MPTFYILGEWFLGCIIALYIVFPIMRWLINKHPFIALVVLIALFCFMEIGYKGEIPQNLIFITRMPEFCFGMYFVKYISFFRKKSPYFAVLGFIVVSIN